MFAIIIDIMYSVSRCAPREKKREEDEGVKNKNKKLLEGGVICRRLGTDAANHILTVGRLP